jgi:HEAT repeat protein
MKKAVVVLFFSTLLLATYFLYPGRSEHSVSLTENVIIQSTPPVTRAPADQDHDENVNNLDDHLNSDLSYTIVTSGAGYIDTPAQEFHDALEDEDSVYDDALLRIQPLLSHVDPIARELAVETLGEYQHQDINYNLVHAMEDPDPDIRIAAIEALSMEKDEFAVFYIEPALYDVDERVRLSAIWAIAERENEQSVHALSGLLSDPNGDIRLNAVAALGEIGGEASTTYVLQNLYDSDPKIRRSAEDILDELGVSY